MRRYKKQTVAHGEPSGLLTMLTGRCIRLRALKLQRSKTSRGAHDRSAEEASVLDWVSFIQSVKVTVEIFEFEQPGRLLQGMRGFNKARLFRVTDVRFGRLILSTLVSGN